MDWEQRISRVATNLPTSGIRKFWDLANSMDNVLSLCVGEPDFPPPQPVLDAIIKSTVDHKTHYTANAGLVELRDEISKLLKRNYGLDYTTDEIVVTIGASEAIDLSLRCLLDPHDEVLIPDPAYVAYESEVLLNNGVPIMVPTYAKDEFRLTVEELEKNITPKTKALLLGFPSNPTGAIMSEEDLKPIAEFAVKHDLLVISDEIYAELNYIGKHVSIASFPNMKERTIVLNGFSKAYAMTGLRIGYLCAPEILVENALKIQQYSIVSAASIVQHGAIAALQECDENVVAMREVYRERRDLLVKGLRDIGLGVAQPNGAFYVFPDISISGLDDETFAEELLMEERVAVTPGSAFGKCGVNHVRISYSVSTEVIEEALRRIDRFVQSKLQSTEQKKLHA